MLIVLVTVAHYTPVCIVVYDNNTKKTKQNTIYDVFRYEYNLLMNVIIGVFTIIIIIPINIYVLYIQYTFFPFSFFFFFFA